ncbi:MAG: Uncharacterized protein XD83_0925, partial [Synergistales bacterium 57_84]
MIKAITFRTPLVKGDEIEMAKAVAEMLDIDLHIEDIDVTSDPKVSANPGDRCYFCRKILHREAARYARTAGLAGIADGVQTEDLDEYRPGIAAAAEDGILHPLAEAGLTKSEIREMARTAGLPNSERPAAPCLATRFPPGVKISRWSASWRWNEMILIDPQRGVTLLSLLGAVAALSAATGTKSCTLPDRLGLTGNAFITIRLAMEEKAGSLHASASFASEGDPADLSGFSCEDACRLLEEQGAYDPLAKDDAVSFIGALHRVEVESGKINDDLSWPERALS